MKSIVLGILFGMTPLLAQKAHVHGDAKLSFLSQDKVVRVEFEAPGQVVYIKESLGDEERKAALDDFAKKFPSAFVWPKNCSAKGETKIEDVAHKSSRKDSKGHNHHHHHDDAKGSKKADKSNHEEIHRDVLATLEVECAEAPAGQVIVVNLHGMLNELKSLRISIPSQAGHKPIRAKKDGVSVKL